MKNTFKNNTLFKSTSILCLGLALLASPSTSFAQDIGDEGSQLSAGALVMGFRSPFTAENKRANGDERVAINVFPYVSYHSENFYFEGMEMGYNALKFEADDIEFSLSAVVSGRMKAGDTRDKLTADAGIRASLNSPLGFLNISLMHDATDTHNGMEAKATLGHSFNSGKFSFTPSVSIIRQNRKMANYVYGVSASDHDKMVTKGGRILTAYTLDKGATNFGVESLMTYAATDRISVLAYGSITFLDKSIKANPGINNSTESMIGLGLLYTF